MSELRHPDEKPHPSPRLYILVGIILIVVTAIEVAAFYLNVPGSILVTFFIVLSVMKFALVVLFFMHLRYDHKLFSSFFTAGLILALAVTLAFITLFDNFDIGSKNVDVVDEVHVIIPIDDSHSNIEIDPVTPVGDGGEGISEGEQLFISKACGTCHTVEGLDNASGLVGPRMNGIALRGSSRIDGYSSEDYIRESINDPGAFVVDGCGDLMIPLASTMTDDEFEVLISYLLTLEEGPEDASCG